MPRDLSLRTAVLLPLAAAMLLCPVATWAQPGGGSVEGSVKGYVDKMEQAKTPDEIVKARQDWVKGYEYWNDQNQGISFATQSGKLGAHLLDDANTLKQVNTAMAFSLMTQATIQPALAKMVAHKSTAVRYLGWRGYVGFGSETSGAKVPILRRGGKLTEAMYADWKTRAPLETSPVVAKMMLGAMETPQGATINPSTEKEAAVARFAALTGAWPAWGQRVMQGERPWVKLMADKALPLLKQVQTDLADPKAKPKITELVWQALWSAGKAYTDKTKDEDKDQTEEQKELAAALEPLLTSLEAMLGSLSGKSERPVAEALKERDPTIKRGTVGIKAEEWGETLKLTVPSWAPAPKPVPKPAPKPTTQPAVPVPAGPKKPAVPVPAGPKKPAVPVPAKKPAVPAGG